MNASGARPIRILVVNNQPSVRRILKTRLALEEDLEVVGEAGDAVEASPLARALRPDVVLTDFEMSGTSSAAATDGLRAAAPWSAVVIFALRDASATRGRARLAGAAPSVAEHRREGMLLATIRGTRTPCRRRTP